MILMFRDFKNSIVFRQVFIVLFLVLILVIIIYLSSTLFTSLGIFSKDLECSNLLSMADVYVSNNKNSEFFSLYSSLCVPNDLGEISSNQFNDELISCLEKGNNLFSETTFLEEYPNFCIECFSYELTEDILVSDLKLDLEFSHYGFRDFNFDVGAEKNILVVFDLENSRFDLFSSSSHCSDLN